jgi:hypothetical protein
VQPADPAARRTVSFATVGRAYICSIAAEKPDSSNSFSEKTTLPSGPTRTLQGTQPFVKARNSAPSPSEMTGNASPYSSFQAAQASSPSIAPM